MAEQIDSVILDVKFETNGAARSLSQVTALLAGLKQQQKELTKEIEKGNDADGSMAKQLTQVNAAIKLLNASQKAYAGQLDTGVELNKQYGDSFREIDAQVRALENQYKSLTKAQRESAEGQALRDTLIQQKAALKEFDAELGNHQRNVGNYPDVLAKLSPAFGNVINGAKKMGIEIGDFSTTAKSAFTAVGNSAKALGKALIANPILAVIAAALALIVGAISKLTAAFKKNDDAMTNLSAAFSIFKPIGTAIGKVFDSLAVALSQLVLKLASGAQAVGRFLERLGLVPKGMSEAAEAAKQLTIAQDDLEESERQYTVNSAKRNKEIAQLRDKAAQSTDIKERLNYLEQARALEEENLEEEKEIAQERLRIAQEVAKQNNDTSDETKNKIAELQAAVENAEANFANGVRRLDQQIKTERQNAIKEAIARRKAQLDAELELHRAYEDMVVAMIEDEDEKAYESRRLQGEREIADLQKRLAEDKNLTAKAKDDLNALIKLKQEQLNNDLYELEKAAAQKRTAVWEDATDETTTDLVAQWKEAYSKLQAQRQVEDAKRKQDARGNSVELAQIELDAAMTQHEQLLLLDETEKAALYQSQEAYELAVIESENRIVEATQAASEAKIASDENWTSTAMNFAQQATNLANALGNRELKEYEAKNNKEKASLERKLAAGLISQETYDKEVARLDDELEKKQKENEIKQAKRAKAIAIMQTIINTAMGIAKAVAENPMFGGLPGSALMAAAGALQLATIIAEPLPTAAKGRYLVGPSHAQGGIQIEAEGGEAIINKRSTAKFKPLLSAINQAGGGVKFADGGMVDESIFEGAMASYGGSGYDMMREAMTEAVSQMPAPTMVYQEFQDFQNNVSTFNEFAAL